MTLTTQHKKQLTIFLVVFVLVFFALATTLHYSPLEITALPHSISVIVNILTFPFVVITTIPTMVLTLLVFCQGPDACPGLLDAYTFGNAVIMISISFFSALLYGVFAVFVSRFIDKMKTKK